MMSERSKSINVCSIPSSSSRLSPLARPFTIGSPFNRHESFDPFLGSSSSSTSGLDQPFPIPNLGDHRHHGYSAYLSDATAITAFPFVNGLHLELDSCFTSYPSEDPLVQTHFTLTSSSLGSVYPKSAVQQGAQEVPRKNDQIASGVSSFCDNPLEQGIIEGSKFVSKKPSVLREIGRGVVGEDDRIRPVGLSFAPRPQDTQSQMSYSASSPSLSHCDSPIINSDICFPHLASCAPEALFSSDPECFSYSDRTFKPSSASYSPPIVNTVPLENVAYDDNDTVSNMDSYFGYVVPGITGNDIMRSQVACQDLVLAENGETRNIVQPVHNETTNPYILAKSKRQIACPKDHEDLIVEQHGAKAGMLDDKWSTNSDDSDVDSPCWRGTQAYKSPLRDSVPVNWEDCKGPSSRVSVPLKLECSKSEKVAHNSLNPLAPVFIPGNSKLKVDYLQMECQGDSFSCTENTEAFAVLSSSCEDGMRGSNKAGTSPSKEINDIGICCSYDVCDPIEEHGTSPSEEYVTPESRIENVAGGLESIANATYSALNSVTNSAHTVPSSSISFPTADIALNSHSIGDGVFSDFTERSQEPTKSTTPKFDAKLLINTIYYLSELLLQNHSFALGSIGEHEYDKVLNIINNLHIVIRNQADDGVVRPKSHHLCTLYGKRQAADHHKIRVTRPDPNVVHLIEHETPPEPDKF